MNILFITEIAPFPPNTGERIRSYNLINSILDFADHLFLISDNPPPDESRYRKVSYLKFPRVFSKSRWKNLLLIYYRNRHFVAILNDLLDSHRIDVAFLDYNFIGNYIRVFKKRGIKVIYGTHNIQSKLNFQIPAETLKDIVFKNLCYLFEKTHELFFFRQANSLIAVSDEDLAYYRTRYKKPQLFLIPNYIDEKEYTGEHVTHKKQQVVMTGTFVAFQNIEGLRWFIEEIWDDQLASLANFIVVGHGSKKHFDEIVKNNPGVKNAEALGSVTNIKKYIAESKAAIIPLRHGSGTRLKCVEAMALRTNIVGTNLGVEGIRHGGTILTADDPQGFKENLLKVLRDEVHHEEGAFEVFIETYSARSNTPRLREIVIKTINGDTHGG